MNFKQIPDSIGINDTRYDSNHLLPDSITGTILVTPNPKRRNQVHHGPYCLPLHQEKEQSLKITAHSRTNPSASAVFNTLLIQEEKNQALRAARRQFLNFKSNTNAINRNRIDVLNAMILQQQTMRLNPLLYSNLFSVDLRDNSVVDGGNDPSCDAPELQYMHAQSKSPNMFPSKQKGRPSLFAQKLHQMLSDLERQPGGTEIASYVQNGRAFQIHDPKKFVKEVIPEYFSMRFMESFKRQLASYNFQQIPFGPDRGAYYNEFFVRGQPELCTRIKRVGQQQIKSTRK